MAIVTTFRLEDFVRGEHRRCSLVIKADASPLTTPRETTETRPTLRASFEVNLHPILKRNTPLQRPCNSLNEYGVLARIQREMTP